MDKKKQLPLTPLRNKWEVCVSQKAMSTLNPIRNFIETFKVERNPQKHMIRLSLGDPTVFGNLKACDVMNEAMNESIKSFKNNGYFTSIGKEEARKAVADYYSVYGLKIDWKDIILTSGCSMAIDLCMTVLSNPGSNILVPRPGFPLYKTLSTLIGVEIRYYDLLPDNNWEIDLHQLESIIDLNTAAIIYNNPSNPCGSVFSKKHIIDFIAVAQRNFVPIIADEIYENIVFKNKKFFSLASLSTEVPVLTCGGIGKKFLIPGWRLGWIIIHDNQSVFGNKVKEGLSHLSQRLVSTNSLIQGALPRILKETPQAFFDNTINYVQMNAGLAYDTIRKMPGLHPVMPSGAMYMMIRIDMKSFPDIKSDSHFVEKLVSEQSVFCLPGKCFEYEGYLRIVLTLPTDLLREALTRIAMFCSDHYFCVNDKKFKLKVMFKDIYSGFKKFCKK